MDRADDPYVDGEWEFNKGSLINDHRWSLAGEEGVPHKEANVSFIEVMVNGWPHIFVISTRAIGKDQELLIDYSAEYWEKILNERLIAKVAEIGRDQKEMKSTF
jgi:hypothetical protein